VSVVEWSHSLVLFAEELYVHPKNPVCHIL
jgi:hypothetical protein